MALARGAALAAAGAPRFDATTVGLAYSQDPDGPSAGSVYAARTGGQLTPVGGRRHDRPTIMTVEPLCRGGPQAVPAGRQRADVVFVVGVVALVISLAVSIRPTVDQRPSPGPNAICRAPGAAPRPRRCRKHSSPSRRLHPRRPSNRRCPSQCRSPPRPAGAASGVRRTGPRPAGAGSRPTTGAPPPAPDAPPPAPIPVAPAPAPVFPRRCTARRYTTRTCRRRFTIRGPSRGRRRGSIQSRTSLRSRSPRMTRRNTTAVSVVAGFRWRVGFGWLWPAPRLRWFGARALAARVRIQDLVDLAARPAATAEVREVAP